MDVSKSQWIIIGGLVILLGIEAIVNPVVHAKIVAFFDAYTTASADSTSSTTGTTSNVDGYNEKAATVTYKGTKYTAYNTSYTPRAPDITYNGKTYKQNGG